MEQDSFFSKWCVWRVGCMLLDCHYVVVLDRYQVHVLNGCASEQGVHVLSLITEKSAGWDFWILGFNSSTVHCPAVVIGNLSYNESTRFDLACFTGATHTSRVCTGIALHVAPLSNWNWTVFQPTHILAYKRLGSMVSLTAFISGFGLKLTDLSSSYLLLSSHSFCKALKTAWTICAGKLCLRDKHWALKWCNFEQLSHFFP